MYAIVKTGDKQYLVGKNDKILVGKIDAKAGTNLVLDQVLLAGAGSKVKLGAANTQVKAKVLRHTKSDKVMVFKFKRRKNYRRVLGHRQDMTLLQITDIVMDGKPSLASKPAAKAKATASKPKASTTKPAAKPKPGKAKA